MQGVTTTAIKLGVISDVGYSGYPGLNQELFDASDVFADWCNSLGGINGHKIEIDKLDAKLTEYKSAIPTACAQDFALVGGGGVFDATGQADRLACLLPDFPGYVVSPEARGVGPLGAGHQRRLEHRGELRPGQLPRTRSSPMPVDAVGYITGQRRHHDHQQAAVPGGRGHARLADGLRRPVQRGRRVDLAAVRPGHRRQGVKGLYFVGSAVNLAKLLGSLAQIGYKLDWVAGAVEHLRPGADHRGRRQPRHQQRLHQRRHHAVPGHRRAGHPAVRGLFDQYLPNGLKTASLGLNSFAAWLLFAQSAKACGADLTRLCVYNQAIHTTSFDGGGLSGQVDPSTPEVPDRLLRAGGRHVEGLHHDRLERQRRSLQLRPEERDPADRRLRQIGEVRTPARASTA